MGESEGGGRGVKRGDGGGRLNLRFWSERFVGGGMESGGKRIGWFMKMGWRVNGRERSDLLL